MNISIGQNWLNKKRKPSWVYSSSPLKRGRNKNGRYVKQKRWKLSSFSCGYVGIFGFEPQENISNLRECELINKIYSNVQQLCSTFKIWKQTKNFNRSISFVSELTKKFRNSKFLQKERFHNVWHYKQKTQKFLYRKKTQHFLPFQSKELFLYLKTKHAEFYAIQHSFDFISSGRKQSIAAISYVVSVRSFGLGHYSFRFKENLEFIEGERNRK